SKTASEGVQPRDGVRREQVRFPLGLVVLLRTLVDGFEFRLLLEHYRQWHVAPDLVPLARSVRLRFRRSWPSLKAGRIRPCNVRTHGTNRIRPSEAMSHPA